MSRNDCMKFVYRNIGAAIRGSLLTAGFGGLEGYIGASVLAGNGYEGYNADEVALSGVVGGAILGTVTGLIKQLAKEAECCQSNDDEEGKSNCYELIGALAVATGAAMAGGVLGRLILSDSASMPYDKTAAAMASGYGIVLASMFGLAMAAMYCYCCCAGAAISFGLLENPESAARTVDLEDGNQRRHGRHRGGSSRASAYSAIPLPTLRVIDTFFSKSERVAAETPATANNEKLRESARQLAALK